MAAILVAIGHHPARAAVGDFSEFSITGGQAIEGITLGPDGNLWFTEGDPNNKIGRMTPAGDVTEFPLSAGTNPLLINPGPDGNLWFTENTANKIGRITPT